MFADVSAAYGTIWHSGFTLKLLRTLPSKEMVRVIMSMIWQRRFHVHIGGKKSRCRTQLNSVPQGSIIAPPLFDLNTHDIPPATSKKHIHADDIALKTCHKHFPEIERVLLRDMDILSTYFIDWRVQFNTTKTASSVFHLANRTADYKELITHPLTNNRLRSRVPLTKRMHSLASDINGTTSPKSWATQVGDGDGRTQTTYSILSIFLNLQRSPLVMISNNINGYY